MTQQPQSGIGAVTVLIMSVLSSASISQAADTTPPVVTITAPAGGATITPSGTTFSGTATDAGTVVKVRIYVYDELRSLFTVSDAAAGYVPSTGAWNFGVLASHITPGGTARLWVQGQDASGNVSVWQNRVVQVAGSAPVRDTTPPTVTVTAPAGGATIPPSGVTFTGTATDTVGVTRVRIYIYDAQRQLYTVNNAAADVAPATGAWSFAVLPAQITPGGTAILWVQAQDAAGNRSSWQFQVVTVQPDVASLGFSRVRIVGTQLLIEKRLGDGTLAAAAPFTLRGVAYSPVDSGDTVMSRAEARQHLRTSRYAEDFALMQLLGANAVKTYVDAGTDATAVAILNEAYARGLMVAVTLDVDAAEIQSVVNAYKDHPALLCWIIGNEWNLNRLFQQLTLPQATAQVEQAAQLIHALDPNHPVASGLGFMPEHFNMGPEIVTREFPAIINGTPDVDVWGLNVYRAESMEPIFMEWQLLSPKPFFLAEFGTDDWNAQTGQVDEWLQANTLFDLWDEVHRHVSIRGSGRQCLGGFAFEWNDEWWKMGNPSVQDDSGFQVEGTVNQTVTAQPLATFRGHPDGVANEEHFGLVTMTRQPKQAFWVLQQAYRLGTLRTEPMAIGVYAAGSGPSGDAIFTRRESPVYVAQAAGVYVMSVARDTGTVTALRRFDTAGDPQGQCATLLSYIQGIAPGDVVAVAVAQNALQAGMAMSAASMTSCVAALSQLGAQRVLQIGFQQPWALVAIAGSPGTSLAEDLGTAAQPAAVLSVVPLDADRDGIIDLLDTDNDNDGVSDAVERARGTDVLDSSS